MELVRENENEAVHCNPAVPAGMEAEASKMRGDAIGDTLYSERWVIKVLIKLVKLCEAEWNEELETELCLLWDMTIEPDVVQFLLKQKFIDLAAQVIVTTNIPRLTEILVGVLGNMSCILEVRQRISESENVVSLLLDLLSVPDALTLVQLMRLIQACAWDLRKSSNKSSLWLQSLQGTDKWLPSVVFVLNSSTNKELLSSTVALLQAVCCVGSLADVVASPDVVAALLEAMQQLGHPDGDDDDNDTSSSTDKVMSQMTQVLSLFTCSSAGTAALVPHADVLCERIHARLAAYEPLDLLSERCADFVSAAVVVMSALLEHAAFMHPPSFKQLVSFLVFLQENTSEDTQDLHSQLLQYARAVTSHDKLREELPMLCSSEELLSINNT